MILGSETRSLFPRSFTPLQLPDHLKENSIAALSSAQRVGKLRDFGLRVSLPVTTPSPRRTRMTTPSHSRPTDTAPTASVKVAAWLHAPAKARRVGAPTTAGEAPRNFPNAWVSFIENVWDEEDCALGLSCCIVGVRGRGS